MRIGLIGCGTVGGTLRRWLANNTSHELVCWDPGKNLTDDLTGVDAIFISVPVPPAEAGQDLTTLIQAVNMAKRFTEVVFIRSTVLPGTSDALKCISCPEFLTARRADQDMFDLPILVGEIDRDFVAHIFTGKIIYSMLNIECELSKFAHNCFGAMKVTYFNIISDIAGRIGADYNNVLTGAGLTGFIEKEHTQVPGPDGRYGYGGTCFPQNIEAFKQFLSFIGLHREFGMFKNIQDLNRSHRTGGLSISPHDTGSEVDA